MAMPKGFVSQFVAGWKSWSPVLLHCFLSIECYGLVQMLSRLLLLSVRWPVASA